MNKTIQENWVAAKDYKWLKKNFSYNLSELLSNWKCGAVIEGETLGCILHRNWYYLGLALSALIIFVFIYLGGSSGSLWSIFTFVVVVLIIVKGKSIWSCQWSSTGDEIRFKTLGMIRTILVSDVSAMEFKLHRSTFELKVSCCDEESIKIFDPHFQELLNIYCAIHTSPQIKKQTKKQTKTPIV